MHIVNLLIDSIASPNPVEVPAQHGPRAVTEGQGGENKWVRKNGPEKDIARIPEDDWETDGGPEGNPGICLGISHHFFRLLLEWRETVTSEAPAALVDLDNCCRGVCLHICPCGSSDLSPTPTPAHTLQRAICHRVGVSGTPCKARRFYNHYSRFSHGRGVSRC